MFLKGGGVQTQRHNTLRVYAKDASPSLAILTTNVPLDHLLKAEKNARRSADQHDLRKSGWTFSVFQCRRRIKGLPHHFRLRGTGSAIDSDVMEMHWRSESWGKHYREERNEIRYMHPCGAPYVLPK